jgi:hypothetical protein
MASLTVPITTSTPTIPADRASLSRKSSLGKDGSSNAPGSTEYVPAQIPNRNPNGNFIAFQPLRRDEMQVRPALN